MDSGKPLKFSKKMGIRAMVERFPLGEGEEVMIQNSALFR
jgi:hypothetical protein